MRAPDGGCTVFDGSYDVVLEALPTRRVQRARLLVGPMLFGENPVLVLDADSDEFVRVPALPDDDDLRLLALAPDGRQLLLLAQRGGRGFDGLCLHTLASGQQQWFNAQVDGQDWQAALSPDGQSIATLSATDDPQRPHDLYGLAVVSVIEVRTGRRRRLWAGPGSHSEESTVSWSPDGHLIAVTYLQPPNYELEHEEEWATVVVDLTGNVIGHYEPAAIPASSNGAWISERDLLMYLGDEEANAWLLEIINVQDGTRRILGPSDRIPLATVEGRLVMIPAGPPQDKTLLVSTNLDGTDPRPFISMRPRYSTRTFDIALPRLTS